MDDVYYVDDFYFDINGNLIRRYMEQVDAERYVEELMVSHNQYHRAVENTNYVTVGSIIGCTYGSILAKLTADEVTEVYVGNGAPVMTCADCATGINIPTFGTCLNPEATQKGLPGKKFGTWGSANGMSGGTYTPEGYKCIPLLDKTWKQPDGKDLIWRDATGTYSYALKDIAVLVCRYGGTIGVVEVNTGAKGSGEITVPHISYKFTHMAVCTDGYDDSYKTATYQQSLAGFNVDKNDPTTPSATKVPYIVIAKNHPDVSQRIRDYGVIIDHSTGKYVYAIVAESGPDNEYREISIKAAWDLGYTTTDGTWGPNGDFEFIIFTGTRTLNYNAKEADILKGIKEEASKYYP